MTPRIRIETVLPGVLRLRLPTPGFVANHLYLFLGEVPTLLDAGHPAPEAQTVLDATLHELGLLRRDFAQVLYTHTHLDHLGGGIVHWATDAERLVPHRIAASAVEAGIDRRFGERTRRLHHWSPWLDALPDHPLIERWRERRRQASRSWLAVDGEAGRALLGPPLREGDRVRAGDRTLTILDVPGHDPHHQALFDEEAGLLFTGDVVLKTPTPLMPPMDDDAALYRESLLRLERLGAARILPAHGPVLPGDAVTDSLRAFDAVATFVLERSVRAARPVGPGELLAEALAMALVPSHERLEAVMLGNLHSHLLRWARSGALRTEAGGRFVAAA